MKAPQIASWLLGLSRPTKRIVAVTVDTAICGWTVWAALYLRLGEWVAISGNQWLLVLASPLLAIPIFINFGLYRTIFRHTGWPAMIAVVRACLVYGVLYSLIFTFGSVSGAPRTVGIIQPVLLFLMIAATRAAAHHLLGGNYRRITSGGEVPRMLIYGAGESGRQLALALLRSRDARVVGFLDDDRSLHGANWHGLTIHDPDDIQELVARLGVSEVVLAVPSASRRRRQEILELLKAADVSGRTVPGLLDLATGRLEASEIRPLQIQDLLGRETVAPDRDLLEKNIKARTVLVTGAGGSIGSELCRQILDIGPSTLLLVEASEYALYTIHSELVDRGNGTRSTIVPLLASVCDEDRIEALLAAWRPDTIYHAAAFKHVPLVEHNATEGIKNNVFGTLTIARLAKRYAVQDFVLISTDKAVRPANIMGATKRLSELVLQAMAAESPGPRYSMVRFGNVLGSSGSVVPLFRSQIDRGGPVTITHCEVTRYFMTIPEAAQLVIQAGAMATGGEVFVLDMGEPVKVLDLARSMIELSGLSVRDAANPDGDVEIVEVGLRPGEKLYEELLIGNDPRKTRHERIMQAREHFSPWAEIEALLSKLQAAVVRNDVEESIGLLLRAVPEYAGEGAIADWLFQRRRAADQASGHANIEMKGGNGNVARPQARVGSNSKPSVT